MRIVREQMLCIITPDWPGGVDVLGSAALEQLLKGFLTDAGVVHFASLVLLPGRPGAPADSLPSLMLELAVDEGIRPHELLAALAHHPSGALWAIYGAYWPDVQPTPVGARNEVLAQYLQHCLSVADGAFVGPRDRPVAQIQQEGALYQATRAYAATIAPQLKQDRSSHALALARWVFQQPKFGWAAEPAPRSFWRSHGGSAKMGYILLVLAALPVLLYLLMHSLRWIGRLGVAWGGTLPPWPLQLAFATLEIASCILSALMHAGARLAVALLLTALVFGILLVVLPALIRPWRIWLRAVLRELDRPSETWSSRLTYVFGWFVLAALVLAAALAAVYVVRGIESLCAALDWLRHGRPPWVASVLGTYAVIFSALLLILWLGLPRTSNTAPNRATGWWAVSLYNLRRWFRRPGEDEVPRAQQIHASIETCEGRLVAGTAHMVSLTELRWPFAWSACWTRAILRTVTSLGHIFFTEGRLGDAPGIQFGHWHIVDGGRRLLFCANFDGTFGGYLDDFINGPSGGTTLFWRWTHLLARPAAAANQPGIVHKRRFPPTRFLLFRGVKCELTFKTYARDSMLPHLFRFDASELSLDEKIRATALRDALSGPRTNAKDDLIMRVIES